MKLVKKQFPTLQEQNTKQTEPESLGLKIMRDKNKIPHLTWNYKVTRTQMMGNKEQQVEYTEYAYVSIDAHDGTIVWKSLFE